MYILLDINTFHLQLVFRYDILLYHKYHILHYLNTSYNLSNNLNISRNYLLCYLDICLNCINKAHYYPSGIHLDTACI